MVTIEDQGLAYIQYKADGATSNFTLTFPYLKQDNIRVFLDGVQTTAFTWNNSSEIHMTSVPANDVLLTIKRLTDQSQRLVDFQDGGVLKEATLDLDSNQLFYLCQEAIDTTNFNLAINATTSTIDANNNRIINVADGVDPQDAATKGQLDVVEAASDAATAAVAVAVADAAAAVLTANGIASTANQALSDAADALVASAAAVATANAIAGNATAALAAANAAVASANAAGADATQALADAAAAQSTANTALTNAATAQSTANTAVSNAATALAAANAAQADATLALGDLATHIANTTAHGATGAVVGTTNTQTLDNKTMTSPVLNSPSIVTPSRSDIKQDTYANLVTYALTASNGQLVWATDLKSAYAVKDTLLVAVGGSSGSLDTLFQLLSEENLSDWSTGNNATILGGGTLAGTFAKETSTPLHDLSSYKFTQAAGSLNDYLMSPSKPVPLRFRGQQVTLFFPVKYDGSDNDIEVKFYDVTNSTVIPTSTFIKLSTGAPNALAMFKTNITMPLTCANIRVGFQVKVLNSGKVLEFDDVQMTGDATVYANIGSGVIGEIVAYSGATLPTDLLACDGTSYLRTSYPELFAAIGTAHGTASSAHFNVPDYRGRFLRGITGASSNDPDAATRTAMNTGGNTGNNVGSVQADGNLAHTHTMDASASDVANALVPMGGAPFFGTVTTNSSGGNEARPKNAYVNYGIRWKTTAPSGIMLQSEVFSTDTATLAYASSSAYTLATLANAPVGTFITYTIALNSNTYTQTTTAPSQTTSSMNINGIQLFTRAFNTASTAASPARVAIQIGKGLKGINLAGYGSVSKANNVSLDVVVASADVLQTGLSFKEYNELTGILLIDSGTALSSSNTTRNFRDVDATQPTSAYIVINASKNPALTGLNIMAVAARAGQSSAQSIAASTNVEVTYDSSKTYDTHGALNTTSGRFTAPESGYYQVNGRVAYANASTWTAANVMDISIFKNSVVYSITRTVCTFTTAMLMTGNISDIVYMVKGDYISMVTSHNRTGGTLALHNDATYTNFSISKLNVG